MLKQLCLNRSQNGQARRVVWLRSVSTSGKHNSTVSVDMVRVDEGCACPGACPVIQAEIKPFSSIPGPRGLPYVGSLPQYKFGKYGPNDYHKSLLEKYHLYGDIFKETIGGETIVHLFSTDYSRQILAEGGKKPYIPPLLEPLKRYRHTRNIGLGLGNINGEEWYRLRSSVNNMMLHRRSVAAYLPNVNEVMTDHLRLLDSKIDPQTRVVPNFNNEIVKLTMEVGGYNTFQKRFGILSAGEDSVYQKLIQANDVLFDCSTDLKFSMKWYNLSPALSLTWNRLVRAEDFFMRFVKEETDEIITRLEELGRNGTLCAEEFPFFSTLLNIPKLPHKDVYAMALSMFSDGLTGDMAELYSAFSMSFCFDQTAPSTVSLLYCLAKNPEKQEKLFREIQSILPADKTVTAETLQRATYLKACVKETFRFFPVQPDLSRIAKEDTAVGGYFIPKGTQIQINMNVLLRSEEHFKNPDAYLPERWLRGETKENVDPYMLLPFSHGPRMCIGRRIAEQEIHVHTLKLLDKYRLSLETEDTLEQEFKMLFRLKKQARIQFSSR